MGWEKGKKGRSNDRKRIRQSSNIHLSPMSASTHSPASNIKIADEQGVQGLRIIEGELSHGCVIKSSRPVTVVPESERVIPSTRALVEYTSAEVEGGWKKKQGYASSVGPIEILEWEDYRIKKGDYSREWTLFGIGASFPIFLPRFVWYKLSTENDELFKKKRA